MDIASSCNVHSVNSLTVDVLVNIHISSFSCQLSSPSSQTRFITIVSTLTLRIALGVHWTVSCTEYSTADPFFPLWLPNLSPSVHHGTKLKRNNLYGSYLGIFWRMAKRRAPRNTLFVKFRAPSLAVTFLKLFGGRFVELRKSIFRRYSYNWTRQIEILSVRTGP